MKKLQIGQAVLLIALMLLSHAVFAAGNDEKGGEETASIQETEHYVIGVSEPTFNHPVRQAHFWAAEIWKQNHANVEILFMDGQKNAAKQIADVEDLIARQVDLIMIVEHAHGSTTKTLQKAVDSGIPVICVDRMLSNPGFRSRFFLPVILRRLGLIGLCRSWSRH